MDDLEETSLGSPEERSTDEGGGAKSDGIAPVLLDDLVDEFLREKINDGRRVHPLDVS